MIALKRITLDILKPHQPNVLEFSQRIVPPGSGCRAHLLVEEVDEQTETLRVVIEGGDIDFDSIQKAISDMGASLHSIDEVEVVDEAEG
jgi:hypothetical protein